MDVQENLDAAVAVARAGDVAARAGDHQAAVQRYNEALVHLQLAGANDDGDTLRDVAGDEADEAETYLHAAANYHMQRAGGQ